MEPLDGVYLFLVRVHVSFRIESRRAEVALIEDLSGVGGSMFLQGGWVLEAFVTEFAAKFRLAVNFPLVRFEGEFVGRLLSALVADKLLVRLNVFGDHVFFECGFVVEDFVTDGALDAGVFHDSHVLPDVSVEAGFCFELATARVANHPAFVAMHVDDVSTEGTFSGQDLVALSALVELVAAHVGS